MVTFKQLEALFWIAQLGSFAAAAGKLNTTQSAISKRIKELEDRFGAEIFDRTKRTARLTEKGEEILYHAKSVLEGRDNFLERVSSNETLVRRFRLGVTELTAMTWLPKLVWKIRERFPKVSIEPQVDLSSNLFRALSDDKMDMIVAPAAFSDVLCISEPLQEVENAWMCAPDLIKSDGVLALRDLLDYTMLTQGGASGTGALYTNWLYEKGINPARLITSESLLAQIGFTLSGLGISYLPVRPLHHLIADGRLKIVRTDPELPKIAYKIIYRSERKSQFKADIASLAQECSDYTSTFVV